MPKVNLAQTPPFNTEGVNRQVAPNVPMLWGDNQIYTNGTYSTPVVTPNSPLHIPKVCRFLYSYPPTVDPPENQWTGCGCPGTGDCGAKVCNWTLFEHKILAAQMVITAAVSVSSDGVDPVFEAFLPTGALFYTLAHLATGYTRLYNSAHTLIYEGPLLDIPLTYGKMVYLHEVTWQRDCTGGSSEDGCQSAYQIIYLSEELSTTNTCSRQGEPNVLFSTGLTGTGVPYWLIQTDLTMEEVSDYPPDSLYDQACIPGPSPCASP